MNTVPSLVDRSFATRLPLALTNRRPITKPVAVTGSAFVFFAMFTATLAAQEQPEVRVGDAVPAAEAAPIQPAEVETSDTISLADSLINQITSELEKSRRPLPMEEFIRMHTNIVILVTELQKSCPDEPRLARFIPKQWMSKAILASSRSNSGETRIKQMGNLHAEIEEVFKTTTDPILKSDAAFFQSTLKISDHLDGPDAASIAEAFVRQWPQDNRCAELLHGARSSLSDAWYMRMAFIAGLALILVNSLAGANRNRKWLRLTMLFGVLGLLILVALITSFPDHLMTRKLISVGKLIQNKMLFVIVEIVSNHLVNFIFSFRFGLGLVLAGFATLFLNLRRNRSPKVPNDANHKTSFFGRSILIFSVALATFFAIDAILISRQRADITRRLAQDYPDSFRGRLAQGKIRRREGLGKPFELEFTDAISGRAISMKDLKGQVVVVEFWATWCGPCVKEIPELKRIYNTYHDQGVAFIGVSQDAPEEDGGLASLKAFVEKEQIPWPQYYLAHDSQALLSGTATSDFSELWGVDEVPTIFLIDANGNLYSTEARGQLDTLIPKLLKKKPPDAGKNSS